VQEQGRHRLVLGHCRHRLVLALELGRHQLVEAHRCQLGLVARSQGTR
jgi:hypothetical protein